MKKQLILIVLMMLSAFYSFAQKYELGKVTLDELNEKVHPKDSSAAAAILFKKGEVRFEYSEDSGFDMFMVVKTKIKIYKKEGYDWANFQRQYYIGGNSKESVTFSKAYTYNVVDGKVEKTKLKSDGEFDQKLNEDWGLKKITMPNIKEGSIIEFEYSLKSPSIGTIDEWNFQTSIPVGYSEFTTYIPEYFVYNPILKGYITPKIDKDGKQRTINYVYTEKTVPGMGSGMPQRINTSMDFMENKTTYSLSDISAMKDESFVNNINNYLCSVYHELSMTRYPNEPFKSYSTDWPSVVKTIYDSENFGGELAKTGYFENDVDQLLKDVSSQAERVAIIFNYVKSKIKWDGYYSYYTRSGVRKAYKDMTGNVAEINLMLVAMLRYANVEANPVLVSTRSNGVPFFPNRTAFNYVIAGIELENNVILLDATDKNSLPNILPIRDLNWNGRIIRKNGSSAEIDLMPNTISTDIINVMATISKDATVEGKVREQYFDYNGYNYRDRYADLARDNYLEKLEKRLNGIEINEFTVTGTDELTKPVVESYSFKHSNLIEVIGDKMYFSPLLFFKMDENPFKQDVREYPVDFAFPNEDRYLINITIPEGYVVESLPQSRSVPMSDDLVSFKYLVANTDNKIQVSVKFNINSSIIPPDYYGELKAMFNEIVKAENEKIVLKKI